MLVHKEVKKISKVALEQTQEIFIELTNILGLFEGKGIGEPKQADISEGLIELLLEVRDKLRTQKNYELSDQIRDKLKALGVILEDSQGATKWKQR